MYTVYIVKTSSNTLYVGQTSNLEKRLKQHKKKAKNSAKYLRYFASFELVYTQKCKTKSIALKREAQLKRLTRSQKNSLIRTWHNSAD